MGNRGISDGLRGEPDPGVPRFVGEARLADALALIKLAEARGNELREPHSKALGGGLYELRGKQMRMFYMFGPGPRMITLLSGIIKKQDRIPAAALAQARRFKADLEPRARRPKTT